MLLLAGCTAGGGATHLDSKATGDSPADSAPADSSAPVDSADSTDSADSITLDTTDTATSAPTAAPCAVYATTVQAGTVEELTLDELSGVAVSRRDPNVLWVEEDHGGFNMVYALDTLGTLLASVTLDGASNNDWEDLSIGPCGDDVCIYLGEIGNNDGDRVDFGVYVFPEPDLADVVDGALTLEEGDWTWYGFAYPGDNENAEALAVQSDGLPVLLTKHYDDETSNVYAYPSLDANTTVTLEALGAIVTGVDGDGASAALTAADLWPDDSRMIVRTYGAIYELDLSGGLAGIAAAPMTELVGAPEVGGEAVAYDPWRGGFWQVAEGTNSALWYTGCSS